MKHQTVCKSCLAQTHYSNGVWRCLCFAGTKHQDVMNIPIDCITVEQKMKAIKDMEGKFK